MLLPLKFKYRDPSNLARRGHPSRSNNGVRKKHGMEWHLNEGLRKRHMKPWPTVGRTFS